MVELLLSLTERVIEYFLEKPERVIWIVAGMFGWAWLTVMAQSIFHRLGEGLMYLLVLVGAIALFYDDLAKAIAAFVGTEPGNVKLSSIGAMISAYLYAVSGDDEYMPEEEKDETEEMFEWLRKEEKYDRLYYRSPGFLSNNFLFDDKD